jgi:hypothetical protein
MPDKSSEEELTADLIAFTHVYSCRFYSKRSAEKLRVTPTADVTKRILELSQQGHAMRVIVATLQKEGLGQDSKGRVISKTVVRRILNESAPVRETIVGTPQTNSFGRFAQQHIKLTGGEGGVPHQHATIYQNYKNWCERTGEAPISNRRVAEYLAAQGVNGRINYKNQKVYSGLQLVNLDGSGIWNKANGSDATGLKPDGA